MARLTRKNIKVFAENASNNGVFGSLQANNPVQTNDVEQIQGLSAWGNGWNDATMTSDKLPPLEEFQGIQYVVTYEQAYLMQEGIPEWDSSCTYYTGSFAKSDASGKWLIYQSLVDNNTNNAVTDTSKWKPAAADIDLSDLSATGKSLASSFSMPSATYDDLTLGASGTQYTAPANGWFTIKKNVGSNPGGGKFLSIVAGNNVMETQVHGNASVDNLAVFMPVKKGTIVTVSYDIVGTTQFFRFVYAEGEI